MNNKRENNELSYDLFGNYLFIKKIKENQLNNVILNSN